MNRLDFYRLRSSSFFEAIFGSIQRVLESGLDWGNLTPLQQGLHGWWALYTDVQNGGLAQFFYNRTDASCAALGQLLQTTGNDKLADALAQAVEIYQRRRTEFEVDNPFGEDGLFARTTEFKPLDKVVNQKLAAAEKSLEKWVREHIAEILPDENGAAIDPVFTGEVESRYPDGAVHEKASVRKGVMNGVYQRFFPDGVLEHAGNYAGGEVTYDYWPNGQPRRTVSTQEKHQVIEWFYPSGALQKRLLLDKKGHAIGRPIELWHENGQLAEVGYGVGLSVGNGPRLRYFEDGAPRLEAKYVKGQLVVQNAWDDERRQVVVDGTGTFHDDLPLLGSSQHLYVPNREPTTYTWSNGTLHGEVLTWEDGNVSSRDEYDNGKQVGESILFHDNGRVRSRSKVIDGKETESRDFPKFDHPKPVVILGYIADEFHYTCWKQPLLDIYPQPRNLGEIQAKAEIPAFLQAVFERNLIGKLKEEYEDLNTFNDEITYMVHLNAAGEVVKVDFMGASAYSIVALDTYPSLIREMKFSPGQLSGRPVPSRILIRAEHTFAESESSN